MKHEIKQAGAAQIYYLHETWINQNHTKKVKKGKLPW
jgi:hypothetical protein